MKRLAYCFICFILCNLITHAANAATNPFSFLWGKTAPTEIAFAPFGFHTMPDGMPQYISFENKGTTALNDAQYLLEFHWRSLVVGTFSNSWKQQVEMLGLYRDLVYFKHLHVALIFGVMTGYGNMAANLGPASTRPLVAHDPGLVVAWDIRFPLSQKFSFHIVSAANFNVMDFGIGYAF